MQAAMKKATNAKGTKNEIIKILLPVTINNRKPLTGRKEDKNQTTSSTQK